jgi:hypothetical protein
MATFTIDLLSGNQYLFSGNFTNSGATTFSGLTSANNGLTLTGVGGHVVKLGGTLTCSTVITQGVGNTAGIEYGGDYSSSYSNRSLVDKGYADTKLAITTFNTYTGNTYTQTQINFYTGQTLTNINSRLLTTVFNTFTGTTAPNTYLTKSSFSIYTGTTVPNAYYNKTQINSYTAQTLNNINSRLLTTVFSTYTGTTVPNNYYNKTQINSYTASTNLCRVTTIGASTAVESTFKGGLVINKIRPTGNTTTAIQINKANGTTHIINIDTVSGFTGFGTIAPTGLIHVYGRDNTPGNRFNLQTNGVRLDGAVDTDKDIVWLDDGDIKFAAQIYRNEGGKFWYLYNEEDENNPITVSESGRIGINNKTDIMNYHAILLSGGPNDLNVSGIYTQNYISVYQVEITGVTGITNTFIWRVSRDNGLTYGAWSAPTGCTTGNTIIQNGIIVAFDNITGHTLGTTFEFPAFPQLPIGTFVVSTNGFTEVQTTNNYNANPIIYDDVTADANSASLGNNIKIFDSGTTNSAIYFGTKVKIDSIYVNLKTAGTSIDMHLQYLNSSSGWTTISALNNNYVDNTLELSISGALTWDSTQIVDWIPEYMQNLVQPNYQLYWLRLITASSPVISPVANSFARGGNYRFAVLSSPSDVKPAMYVDSLSRVNIGGGNITGKNVFQINTGNNILSTSGVTDSLAEIDSENSSITDLKLKLSSNDVCGPGVTFVSTRGTLNIPLNTISGDTLGRVDFKGRFGTCAEILSRINSEYTGIGTVHDADLLFNTAQNCALSEKVRITSSGTTGFGISNPNAVVHLKAGTTSIAPLKFTAGPLLSVPQIGAVEFDGHYFKFTVSGSTIRKTFASLESPQFSGNTNLPSTTCLNNSSLCNYILQSGGTNNTTLVTTCTFNTFTGATQPIRDIAITGATNGLCKPTTHTIGLGGNLTQNTVITGNTNNFTLSAKLLTFCGVNGIEIIDTSTQGIDINSNGNSVDIRGGTIGGVEKTKFLVSATQATFTDSRAVPAGIQYNADYSSGYTARSLVDKGYVDSIATGIIVKAAVEIATTGPITLSGNQTIDGVLTTTGMRVLVKNQASGATNGIYSATTGAWGRTSDFNGIAPDGDVSNSDYMTVISGNTNKNTSWILQTPNPITVGVTSLTFALFSTIQGTIAGNGICVTQSGGDNVIAIKLASNCGLCSDASGLYITPTIGGVGICFDGNTLCFNGSAIAGNSLSWSGTQLNVNISGGTLNSALNSKLNISDFDSYSGATLININSRVLTTTFDSYTGTTSPATYALLNNFNLYTGTTAPATYYNKTQINSYTGKTQTTLSQKAFLSGATFTGKVCVCTPIANDNTNCAINSAWYIGQGATANPLMDGIAGCGVSNLFARQDHVHPRDTNKLSCSGGTMTGILKGIIFSGSTCVAAPVTIGTTCVCGPVVLGSTCVCSPIVCGSSCVCSPIVCASSCVRGILISGTTICSVNFTTSIICGNTCITSPIICASSCIRGIVVSGTCTIGSTCVCSPVILGSTCVCSPITCGSTCVISPITIGSTCVCSPVVLGSTSICSPIITGSTKICSPIICGTSCITSPVACGTTCSASPLHCGACVFATTVVCSPIITGSTKVCSPIIIGTTCVTSPVTIGSTCICSPIVLGSTSICSPVITGSTKVCSPIVCGTSCVTSPTTIGTTCVCSPIVCGSTCAISPITIGSTCVCSPVIIGSTCSSSPLHCGSCVLATVFVCTPIVCGTNCVIGVVTIGSTCVCSPVILGSTSICSPVITGSTKVCSPIVCATTCSSSPLHCGACVYATSFVCSPVITGSTKVCSPTIIATTCLCSAGVTKLVGATTGSTLFLTTTPPAGSIQDSTLFWDSTTKQLEALVLTGGSDFYRYCECAVGACTATATCQKYLGFTGTSFLGGRYKVDFNVVVGQLTANRCTFSKFDIDGTVQGHCFVDFINHADFAASHSVSRDVTLSAGTHCFDIYYWSGAGGSTCACAVLGSVRAKRIC